MAVRQYLRRGATAPNTERTTQTIQWVRDYTTLVARALIHASLESCIYH